MKSTINPCTLGLLHNIVVAGCDPSKHNVFGDTPSEAKVSINSYELLQMEAVETCLAPAENDLTINWSEKLAFVTVVISGHSKLQGSKRLDIVTAGSFQTKISKRYLGVA